jgi:choline dehydrogenase-like flavoprotein
MLASPGFARDSGGSVHLEVLPLTPSPAAPREPVRAAVPSTPGASLPLDIGSVERSSLSPAEHRAALALAEAMLPGSARVPGADERTLLRAEDIVRAFHPVMMKPLGAALRLLDGAAVLSTGRPFHKLDGARQQALLRAWEKNPVMRAPLHALSTLLKFAHFDDARIYGAMGGHFKVVQNVERSRHFSQIIRADAWEGDDVIECDVVVIGTGAGGAVAGKELAERGHAVVFVEEGEHYTRDAFNGSMLRAHGVFYRNALVMGNAPMPTFIGRLLGGSTAVNGGTSFRTPPWVLDDWCSRLGTDEFSPAAMAPLFERVESTLQVGIPERRFIGPIADIIGRGCDAYGWHHAPIARNAVGCEGGGFCDFGCATGAKRSTEISYLPGALNRGAIALTGLRADRILQERGRAVGIAGVTAKGRRLTVRARAVVLAAGAIPTPAFLLARDLCNGSGQVGRNLTLHPSGALMGVFNERTEPAKYIPQAYHSAEFLRQGVLLSAAQPDLNIGPILFPNTGRRLMESLELMPHLAGVAVVLRDASPNGRVYKDIADKPVVTYNLQPKDVENFHFGMVRAAEMFVAAGARTLIPALVGAEPTESRAALAELRRRPPHVSQIALTSYHPLGTCKMGRDPRTSVVGLDHQAHELPGLFIVDGSTVPSALGVNPQITIMAMATRAAGKIDEALG